MPIATDTATPPGEQRLNSIWVGSTLGGLLGGVFFALVLQFVMMVISSVAALYGFESVLAGWAFHLFHAAVFGLVFGLIVTIGRIRARIPDPGTLLVLGALWGVFLWLVAASVVMPVWLESVGAIADGTVPSIDLASGIGHLVYGLTVAAVVAVIERDRFRTIHDQQGV